MKITHLHVRFYKAFNFDYLRKYHRKAEHLPWEMMDEDSWYPFVTVPLEAGITTVVGANESGKTQVLDAIEVALTGQGAQRTDFCRYSRFFLIDRAKRKPDFGATFSQLTEVQASEIGKSCGRGDQLPAITEFTLIRGGNGTNTIYVRDGKDWATHPLNAKALKQVDAVLPHAFRLDPKIPLPDAVPLSFLSQGGAVTSPTSTISSRRARIGLLSRLAGMANNLVESKEAVAANAEAVAGLFIPVAHEHDKDAEAKFRLADDLLVNITGVDRDHFTDLIETISDGRDGYVDGVEELINRSLATRLNFRRWWTQDSSFQLRVTIRESDIAFIIRDRTGTHYSFGERSGGLSYFLSYFVQYLSHQPIEGRDEVLLMDEPDTFLSSQGQKDLLRIFDAFAHPEDGSAGCQGAPRSGGRTHQGVDMFAARGTPVVAPVSGRVGYRSNDLGGPSFQLWGDDGNYYYGAHMSGYGPIEGSVAAGTIVGYVGDSGNAAGTSPHLHFEIHPGGRSGDTPAAVNPTPAVAAACAGNRLGVDLTGGD